MSPNPLARRHGGTDGDSMPTPLARVIDDLLSSQVVVELMIEAAA